MKNYDQVTIYLLVLFLFISPTLWMVVGNIPVNFWEKESWVYLMTFSVLAFSVFVALNTTNKK